MTAARRIGLAVPAAGAGRRMGGTRKPWIELNGSPLLLHTLRPFLDHSGVHAVRVALSRDEVKEPPVWLIELDERLRLVAGGETRAHSVREAVRALPEVDVVVVHDAARPLVTREIIDRCVAALAPAGDSGGVAGAVAGWPATDTLKEIDEQRRIVSTPERRKVWHAQTPQAFLAEPFREACERLEELSREATLTDDASVAEAHGLRVVMVEGGPWNLKVTGPEDVAVAEQLMRAREGDRAGVGQEKAP